MSLPSLLLANLKGKNLTSEIRYKANSNDFIHKDVCLRIWCDCLYCGYCPLDPARLEDIVDKVGVSAPLLMLPALPGKPKNLNSIKVRDDNGNLLNLHP